MSAVVVDESMFGNTEREADAIGEGLEAFGDVRVVEVGEAHTSLGDVDLLVVVRRLPGSAARAAARALRHKHALVAPPQSFYVQDISVPCSTASSNVPASGRRSRRGHGRHDRSRATSLKARNLMPTASRAT